MLSPVVTNGFHRASFFSFLAAGFFFGRLGLLIDIRIAAVLIAFEIVRSGFAAQIAIDALIVHVIFARCVFRVFVCNISHKIFQFRRAIWSALRAMASALIPGILGRAVGQGLHPSPAARVLPASFVSPPPVPL